MKRFLLLLVLFVNIQIVITRENIQMTSSSLVCAQHMTQEAGDNCYDEEIGWYKSPFPNCDEVETIAYHCRYCLKGFDDDEAAIASMVTGRPAMTYNPAVVMALLTKTLEQFVITFDDSNIYKYIMEGDPITRWQEKAGCNAWGHRYDVLNSNPQDDPHSIYTMFKNLK